MDVLLAVSLVVGGLFAVGLLVGLSMGWFW
jgi:hypothetical protein